MTAYASFIAGKTQSVGATGFDPPTLCSSLFPHQSDLTRWALRRGRAAVFAATGLGKSRIEAEWAHRVVEHTGGNVLVLAPLAVAPQFVEEGAAIGVPITLCRDGADVRPGVNVTNYDRLHRFDTGAFAGVVCDESSCIKHQNSKTLATLLEAFRETPFKLSATATPAPNDYTELGTQAEFLGVCTRTEMLSEYFVHDGGETQVWRLKGHARDLYWRWVASWGALLRSPADLGYPDDGYALPPLRTHQHVIPATNEEAFAAGRLFVAEAGSLSERRASKRASIGRRVEACAALVNSTPGPWVLWCNLNDEGDALRASVDGAVEIRGADDADVKESRIADFVAGRTRVLISKSSITGWGLNWQHCHQMAFVGVDDSWEAYFQAVRRCWRFRQTKPVDVHVFASEAEGSVLANLARKEADASRMAEELSAATRDIVRASVRGSFTRIAPEHLTRACAVPAWLKARTA